MRRSAPDAADAAELSVSGARPGLTVDVLGPLEVAVDGRPVVVTTGRLRTVLVALAMSAGTAVSVERLGEAVWTEDAPRNVRRSVHTYLTRLRGLLGAQSIGTTPAGYLLRIAPDQVDALHFLSLLDDAATAADPTTEHHLLTRALALWRADPFVDLPSTWLAQGHAPRLVERYLGSVERRIDLDLAAGRCDDLPSELRRLTAAHPLRESLWARLLTVLDRTGQRAEALRQYEVVRARIADQLGVDPGPALRRLHAALLTDPPSSRAAPRPGWLAVPRQLPADVEGFTGRGAALGRLTGLLAASRDAAATRPAGVAVIAGAAGVGKTALAVHWGHQVVDRFPDGQLYVNLKGFDPAEPPVPAATAIRGFLAAFGVPPHRMPASLDAQVGLFRSLVADRKVLIVLDNARDAAQVRPLLPGAPDSLAVVTSRDQLTSLVATGGRPVALDLLSDSEAWDLLARRLGRDRVAQEPAAVERIILRCARLPLALAIVAARAATRPHFPLAAFAAQLDDAQNGLAAFSLPDAAMDVQAVFSWSYRTLSTAAARLFRLLGLHPGPDIAPSVAASLAGVDVGTVLPSLAELCRAHLLTERVPGRYSCHDLLRRYATELADHAETDDERRAALHRVLDHYLHTAHAGARLLNPQREPIPLPAAQPGVTPDRLTDYEQALAWFTAEHPTLVAAVAQAAGRCDGHAWRLAWTLTTFVGRRGHWHDWITCQQTALQAAHRSADPSWQALSHRELGRGYARLGSLDDADRHYRQAIALYCRLGDDSGRAHTHVNLSRASEMRGDPRGALRHAEEALRLFQVTGNQVGQARALNNVGWFCGLLGRHQDALAHCQRALAVHQRLGDQPGQAATWDSLGYAHYHLGHYPQAVSCYERALALFRTLGDRYNEADILGHVGDSHHASGNLPDACHAWRLALRILDELGHPDTEGVRAKLTAAGGLRPRWSAAERRVATVVRSP